MLLLPVDLILQILEEIVMWICKMQVRTKWLLNIVKKIEAERFS